MTRERAEAIIKAIVSMRDAATDATASLTPQLFPTLKGNGALVKAGTRINHNGTIKRAAVDLWDTAANAPDAAPSLWEALNYREGYRIIPDVITVGTAFSNGEIGWWGDVLMRSKAESNVYTPDVYPANWEVYEREGN